MDEFYDMGIASGEDYFNCEGVAMDECLFAAITESELSTQKQIDSFSGGFCDAWNAAMIGSYNKFTEMD